MKSETVVSRWSWTVSLLLSAAFVLVLSLSPGYAEDARTSVRISNSTFSSTSMPLLAARDWKFFADNGLNVKIILMRSSSAAAALASGGIEFVGGVGPASVGATLRGLPSRAVWISSSKITYSLMANPRFSRLQGLKGKKLGVSGLGGTSHTAFLMAVEKLGMKPQDFVIVALPPAQLLQALLSGFVDGAIINPPSLFLAEEHGFHDLLDIDDLVEMPAGGLTTTLKLIRERPQEVQRVVKSVQQAKMAVLASRDRTIALIRRVMKLDPKTSVRMFELLQKTLPGNGVPTRTGIENIVKILQAEGRFKGRTVSYEDVVDPRFAIRAARELGLKAQ